MSGFSDLCLTKSISFQPVGDDDKIKCFITFERVQNDGKNSKFSGLAVFKRDVKNNDWDTVASGNVSLLDLLKAQKDNSPLKVTTGKEFPSFCEVELFTV